ncbi:hypothetical protein ACXYN8_10135 [Altererythrobacter sp. CAU 1778]
MDDFTYTKQGRTRPAGPSVPRLIASATIIAFLLGIAMTVFVAWRTGYLFPAEGQEVALAQDAAAPASSQPSMEPREAGADAASTPVAAMARVEEQQGGMDSRLAALEQRLTRLDLQTQAASGNAARAEGLLIAFATRRSLERGDRLGYLGEQLRLRFGDAQPNAVNTLTQFSQRPVTLDQLLARLNTLSPTLDQASADESALTMLRREMGELFTIRSEDTPSPQPQRRLERARRFLESGRANAAVAEVEALPGANGEDAKRWLRDARRYASAQLALERIESAAILEPRNLRDGEGNRVEQLSPASAG